MDKKEAAGVRHEHGQQLRCALPVHACGSSRGRVTDFSWFHHLGKQWMALFFAQDSGHLLSEGCRVINQRFRFR